MRTGDRGGAKTVGRRRDAEKKERRAERHMLLGIKYNCCYCLLLSVAHSWCSAAGLGSGDSPTTTPRWRTLAAAPRSRDGLYDGLP